MTAGRFHVSLLAALVFASGCSPSESASSDSTSAVVNGTPSDAAPAVGYLATVISGESDGPFCTATLVAPNLVLTAAHCLNTAAADLAKYKMTFMQFGTGRRSLQRTVPIALFRRHPLYHEGGKDSSHDVGYVVLAKPMTGVRPLTLLRTPHSAGCNFDSIGYGISKDGYNVKKDDTVTADDYGDRLSLTQCAKGGLVGGAGGQGGMVEVSNPDGALCQGDSGGPLRVLGQEAVVGVLSYVLSGVTGCVKGTQGFYAPVVTNLAFIDEGFASAKAALDPPPPSRP